MFFPLQFSIFSNFSPPLSSSLSISAPPHLILSYRYPNCRWLVASSFNRQTHLKRNSSLVVLTSNRTSGFPCIIQISKSISSRRFSTATKNKIGMYFVCAFLLILYYLFSKSKYDIWIKERNGFRAKAFHHQAALLIPIHIILCLG